MRGAPPSACGSPHILASQLSCSSGSRRPGGCLRCARDRRRTGTTLPAAAPLPPGARPETPAPAARPSPAGCSTTWAGRLRQADRLLSGDRGRGPGPTLGDKRARRGWPSPSAGNSSWSGPGSRTWPPKNGRLSPWSLRRGLSSRPTPGPGPPDARGADKGISREKASTRILSEDVAKRLEAPTKDPMALRPGRFGRLMVTRRFVIERTGPRHARPKGSDRQGPWGPRLVGEAPRPGSAGRCGASRWPACGRQRAESCSVTWPDVLPADRTRTPSG